MILFQPTLQGIHVWIRYVCSWAFGGKLFFLIYVLGWQSNVQLPSYSINLMNGLREYTLESPATQ